MSGETTRALMLLRIQLYGAAQTLKGQDLLDFKSLLEEVLSVLPAFLVEEP